MLANDRTLRCGEEGLRCRQVDAHGREDPQEPRRPREVARHQQQDDVAARLVSESKVDLQPFCIPAGTEADEDDAKYAHVHADDCLLQLQTDRAKDAKEASGREEEPGERIPFAVRAATTRDDSPSGPIFRGKSFADVADRALVATRAATADNCSTLGGKTAEEIDQSKELNKRVSELREALREKSSIKLGGQQQVLERVGGAGGNSYQRQCPPGFVVTGFRGGQGQFLDSIEIVCNAIE